jgi:RNA 2',3'-cyclic 3'-phosphodiesterase
MVRLFVALDLPEAIKEQLADLIGNLPDTRWTPPDQQHITLRFIGEVDGGAFRDSEEALAGLHGHPFELQLKGIGHFPPRGEPRVLWAGIEPSRPLKAFKRRVDSALREVGLPPEGRKFSPHVTIARFRLPPPPSRFQSYLSRHSLFRSEPFAVSGFSLYSSWLRSEGAIHQREAGYELVPGVEDEVWQG